MNLNQLYYFRTLAELQNFTKASSKLYVSQPSLSYSMANLEKELGISLFKKKGRNVVLTNHGKEFYICVEEVLTKLEHGITKLKQTSDISKHKISIGTSSILPSDFIPKNLRTFISSFPQTNFDIFTCITNNEVITGIMNEVYDIGFCYKVETEKDLIFVPILKQEIVVLTKLDHELSKEEILMPSHLQKYPLITYRENSPLGIYIRNLFKEQKILPNIIFSFDGEVTISEMVAHNFGIGVLVNTPILRSHNLAIIPLDVKSDLPILYLAYKNHCNYSKYVKNFIHLLETSSKIIPYSRQE